MLEVFTDQSKVFTDSMSLYQYSLCSRWYGIKNEVYLLLFCPFLHAVRKILVHSLHIKDPPSYSDVLSTANSSRSGVSAFITFSYATLNF